MASSGKSRANENKRIRQEALREQLANQKHVEHVSGRSKLHYKWYVYYLVDPTNNEIFYVGKGTKGRINDHEREARADSEGSKVERIRQIWKAGHDIKKVKIAYFNDEDIAYQFESNKINENKNLTNVKRNKQRAKKRYVSFSQLLQNCFKYYGESRGKEEFLKLKMHFGGMRFLREEYEVLYNSVERMYNG